MNYHLQHVPYLQMVQFPKNVYVVELIALQVLSVIQTLVLMLVSQIQDVQKAKKASAIGCQCIDQVCPTGTYCHGENYDNPCQEIPPGVTKDCETTGLVALDDYCKC